MRSILELCLPCRMAQQRRERWTTYAVQEDISRPRKKHPIEVLQSRTREPRVSLAAGAISRQDRGRVSSPQSESMLQILPCPCTR